MAKATGPLLSCKAWGTIAKALTYQRRRGKVVVYAYTRPRDVRTLSQQAYRKRLAAFAYVWSIMHPCIRDFWDMLAIEYHMTGFNLYVRECWESGSCPLMEPIG